MTDLFEPSQYGDIVDDDSVDLAGRSLLVLDRERGIRVVKVIAVRTREDGVHAEVSDRHGRRDRLDDYRRTDDTRIVLLPRPAGVRRMLLASSLSGGARSVVDARTVRSLPHSTSKTVGRRVLVAESNGDFIVGVHSARVHLRSHEMDEVTFATGKPWRSDGTRIVLAGHLRVLDA